MIWYKTGYNTDDWNEAVSWMEVLLKLGKTFEMKVRRTLPDQDKNTFWFKVDCDEVYAEKLKAYGFHSEYPLDADGFV